jgi:hypothetical protein
MIRRKPAKLPAATAKKPAPPSPNAVGAGALPGNTAPTVLAAPQNKQAAAKAAQMNLSTDDSWSTSYWTDGDLHLRERELFG